MYCFLLHVPIQNRRWWHDGAAAVWLIHKLFINRRRNNIETMDGRTFLLLTALFAFAMLAGTTDASYLINNINTTVVLNTNTSASVTEILNLSISNSSAGQYTADPSVVYARTPNTSHALNK